VIDKVLKRSPAAPGEEADEFATLCAQRIAHLVPVREPLVLVSQIQRSGGTLLSQLFDGHPECHAHPHELTIGHPKSRHWPRLDLKRPGTWYEMLVERHPREHFLQGYRKPAERPGSDEIDVFHFLFPPRLQREIFESVVASGVTRARDVLDAYFTSYFNAWLDNHNLYTRPKKAVTAFAPRFVTKEASVAGLFGDYPDGFLISIVRDPCAWYASVRRQDDRYADVDWAIGRWRQSAQAALDARERYGERVVVVTYESLVLETEPTMRRIADAIGISMAPILLEPTFNGQPIRANSSDPVRRYGVVSERATAYRKTLEQETIAQIEKQVGDLYEHVENHCRLARSSP
jgi:Sulfotransferase family